MTNFAEHWQCRRPSIIDAPATPDPIPPALPGWLSGNGESLAPSLSAHGDLGFGDPPGEARAALEEDVVAPLVSLGSLCAQGSDADSFLQGQLSNDLAALSAERAQLSSYSNPKGRVIALAVLTREADSVRLEIAAELAPALMKRLRMFVMRAKVQWSDLGASHPFLGLSGPNAARILQSLGLPAPDETAAGAWACARAGGLTIVRRPGAMPRYTLQAPAAQLDAVGGELSRRARPVGTAAWRLLDVLASLPAVTTATQEHFVLQMLNLDRLGGVSFSKGCYPGQEVVARLHYLGQLKRRMVLAFVDSGAAAAPGDPVYAAGGDGQAVGEIVSAAPHPARGTALLAVLQTQSVSGALRLGSPEGAAIAVDPESAAAAAA